METLRTLISIKNLNKKYKTKSKEKVIANNLSFDIHENEKIGIIGKNGVGKTTVLNMIIGKTKQNSGQIIMSPDLNNKFLSIGYMEQIFKFPSFLKVIDIKRIIYEDLKNKNIFDEPYVESLYKLLNINDILFKKYKKLSGGEQQKMNLFFVVIYKNKLLILDEFSNNMDLMTSTSMRKILKESKSTILIVSHNVYEISEICNRIIVLNNGLIKKDIYSKKFSPNKVKKLLYDE